MIHISKKKKSAKNLIVLDIVINSILYVVYLLGRNGVIVEAP